MSYGQPRGPYGGGGPTSRKEIERGAAIRTLTIGVFSAVTSVFGVVGLIAITTSLFGEFDTSPRGTFMSYSFLGGMAIGGAYGSKYIYQGIRHLRIVITESWDDLDSLE